MVNTPIHGIMDARESGSDGFNATTTDAHGFLSGAKDMLAGALLLGQSPEMPTLALTLLCGYACETALKAVMAKTGLTGKDVKKKYGHNIILLWTDADNAGFLLPKPQPDWVEHLHRLNNGEFYLRYPVGINGIVLPNQLIMLQGTKSLVELASKFVG